MAGSDDRSGELAAGVGVPPAGVYLELLGGRCRPNTVLAAASDLKVFFMVVAKPPEQVRPADVLAFITAQRTGRAAGHGVLQPVDLGDEPGGVSAVTVRRRLPHAPLDAGRPTPGYRPPRRAERPVVPRHGHMPGDTDRLLFGQRLQLDRAPVCEGIAANPAEGSCSPGVRPTRCQLWPLRTPGE